MILEAGRLFHNSSMEEFSGVVHIPHSTVALKLVVNADLDEVPEHAHSTQWYLHL